MIVFVNGSFGVGKTTIAEMLVERIPNSLLFDPEEVGFMLRKIITPIDWPGDFQNYPMWRTLVVETAKGLKENYNRNLIMPMTIWRSDYFIEVMSGLALIEPELHHFCLIAPDHVVRQRIGERGDQPEGDWIYQQVENCVSAFGHNRFETKIDASSKSPEEIAQIILEIVNTRKRQLPAGH